MERACVRATGVVALRTGGAELAFPGPAPLVSLTRGVLAVERLGAGILVTDRCGGRLTRVAVDAAELRTVVAFRSGTFFRSVGVAYVFTCERLAACLGGGALAGDPPGLERVET